MSEKREDEENEEDFSDLPFDAILIVLLAGIAGFFLIEIIGWYFPAIAQ